MSPPDEGGRGGAVRVLAPAKINLSLEVLGRGADGYHEIDTTMLALDHADVLDARLTATGAELQLTLDGPARTPDVPAGASNLAWRAADAVRALARERTLAGAERGVELRLEKHVPSGAGLGGGSADAAAAALAVAELLGLDPDDDDLRARLAALGADCAFFLEARASGFAHCSGRGARVAPLPAPPELVVGVVTPELACSTARVYAAHASLPASAAHPPFELGGFLRDGLEARRARLFNRLERAAVATYPALERWRELLDASSAEHFRLCGSGSSFYGLFDDEPSARGLVEELAVRAKARDLALRARFVARSAGLGAHRVASK